MRTSIAPLGATVLLCAAAMVVGAPPANAAVNFQMPFPCGQSWSGQTRSYHSPANAVDLNRGAPGEDEGDTVVAAAAGRVSRVENKGNESYGRWIEINHGGGWTSRYAHLSKQLVSVGNSVDAGQKIGRVGNTGGSSGSHLHYEQLYNGSPEKIRWNGSQISYWGSRSYKSGNCAKPSKPPVVNADTNGGGNGKRPPAETNPYTAVEACGDDYKVIDSKEISGGKVYLLDDGGKKCVATMKTSKIGDPVFTRAFIEVQGSRSEDKDEYLYYAGPVRKIARGGVVKWGGEIGGRGGYSGTYEFRSA